MPDPIKQATPPYTTYKSFINLIKDLRENGTPPHITRSVVKGSNSGKAMMMASLKYLKLVDASAAPTSIFLQLIESEQDYSKNLQVLLSTSYSFLFDDSINMANTTTEKVMEKFKDAGASGSTISKCMAFFLVAAKDAGIVISNRVKAPPPTRKPVAARKVKKTKEDGNNGNHDEIPPSDDLGIPEDMERITVPLRNMDDGIIFFPPNLELDEAKKAVKMAVFILNNFYGIEEV